MKKDEFQVLDTSTGYLVLARLAKLVLRSAHKVLQNANGNPSRTFGKRVPELLRNVLVLSGLRNYLC